MILFYYFIIIFRILYACFSCFACSFFRFWTYQRAIVISVYFKLRGGRNVKNQNIEGQNVESIFKDDHNVERSELRKSERRKSERQKFSLQIRLLTFWYYLWRQKRSEHRKSKNDFRRSDFWCSFWTFDVLFGLSTFWFLTFWPFPFKRGGRSDPFPLNHTTIFMANVAQVHSERVTKIKNIKTDSTKILRPTHFLFLNMLLSLT